MRCMKKVLALFMTFCISFSTFGNSVLAEEGNSFNSATGEITVSDDSDKVTDEDSNAKAAENSSNEEAEEEIGNSIAKDGLSEEETDNSIIDDGLSEGESDNSIIDDGLSEGESDNSIIDDELSEDVQSEYNGEVSEPNSDESDADFTYTLEVNNATVTGYTGELTDLIIPEKIGEYTVVRIGSSAFAGNTLLTSVVIPDSVTEIEQKAFSGCISLESVTLPKKLNSLGFNAFLDCEKLSAIEIPKSLSSAGNRPFEGCDNLSTVTFEDGTTKVVGNLFASCDGIREIEIPSTVNEIEGYAFNNCTNLEKVIFKSDETIEGGATNITKIGDSVFASCTALEEIIIPDSVKEIEQKAFSGCKNLENVTLSKKLNSLGFNVFLDCEKLSAIEIPKSLSSAGNRPFEGCDNLRTVTFEDGATKVVGNLFASNDGIREIEIPSTVNEIEGYAFNNCTNLEKVIFKSDETIEGGATNITKIGDSAFASCTALEEIIIPDSVKEIEQKAFSGCTNLGNVTLSKKLNSLGFNVFLDCEKLSAIEIPKSLTSANRPFEGCDNLSTVTFGEGTTKVVGNLFASCDGIREIIIPSPVSVIESYAFNDCNNLEVVNLPDTLTEIQTNAFANCSSLTEITIPKAVETIGYNAFSNPARLTIYGVVGSYAETYAESIGANFVGLEVKATEVSLNTTELIIEKGSTAILTISVTPADFTDEISWQSSNEVVATVDDTGLVTANAVGTATITVTVGEVSASCNVTVEYNDPDEDETDKYEPGIDDGDNPYYTDKDPGSDYETDERIDLSSVGGEIAKIKAKTYDGNRYEPAIKVTIKNEKGKKVTLTEGLDYRIIYKNNLNASEGENTAKVTVKGNGMYKGEIPGTFTINPKSIKKLKVVVGSMAVNDKTSELPIYVYDGATRVKLGKDYTLSDTAETVTTSVSKGYVVTITGKGNYTGTTKAKIPVYDGESNKIINPDNVTLAANDKSVPYTGSAIKVEPKVEISGNVLVNKQDYKLSYKNNKDAGTAFVIVTGKGDYKGTVVVPFKITAKTGTLQLAKEIPAKTYNGKLQKPSVTVKSDGKTLKKNKDYTIYYKSNIHAGTATVVINGKGNYKGVEKLEKSFTINPQKIKKVTVKGTLASGLSITYNKYQLKEKIDYTLEYGEVKKTNIKVTIIALPDSDFEDTVTKNVKIYAKGEEVNVPPLKDADNTIYGKTGDQYQLEFENPDDVVLSAVQWNSSDSKVVSVDDAGLLTMNDTGTVIIEVTVYGAFVQRCYVIVNEEELNDDIPEGNYYVYRKKKGSTDDTADLSSIMYSNSYDGVYITAGVYWIDPIKSIPIGWKNNFSLIMSRGALIMAIGNSEPETNVIWVYESTNITISGGTIIGDRYRHNGTKGEAGHGIGVYACTDVNISDMEIYDCWGDGLYIGSSDDSDPDSVCKDVTITNCNIHNNRRNNLSITAADNVKIDKCHFNYAKGTAPQFGIDIETNVKSRPCKNITITNSEMIGNAKASMGIMTPAENIRLENCELSGHLYNDAGKNVVLKNTKVGGEIYDKAGGVKKE